MVRDSAVRRGWLAGLALGLALALLAATYAGPLHPLGDSLAVGRPLLAGGLAAAGLSLPGAAGRDPARAGAPALVPILSAARPVTAPGAPPGLGVSPRNRRLPPARRAPL
ncbi:hypothetical protein IX56_10300, partial [Paracoccus sanguinis]